ncbi:MAG TPA: DNA repair protein RecO [Burkholderiales bacterium]|nr:DNA repair protein RecO [Burkholderiales bacterium]
MPSRGRIDREAAFVLHAYPYSETSLLVEAFSRTHGRLPLVAKGARRQGSPLRGALLAFQPLTIAWSGRGDVRTLVRCEWHGGHPLPRGEALLCGFYMNELLLRLLPREDPHEQLFDHYALAVAQLAQGAAGGPVLRAFERRFLQELGYALTLDRDASTGAAIEPERLYRYEPERGPVPTVNGALADDPCVVPGRVLLALARDDFADASTAAAARQLMSALIDHRLDRQTLHSRTIFRELQGL